MTQEMVFVWTQSGIALIVVIGGGAFFFLRPGEDASAIVGIVGMVVGWYFRSAASNQQATQQAKIAAAQSKSIP